MSDPPRQGDRAGLVSRVAAAAIDIVVVGLFTSAVYLAAAGLIFAWDPRGFRFPRPELAVTLLAYFFLAVVYLGIGWSASGRTIGNQLAGLRVMDVAGARVRPLVAYVRGLLYVIFPAGLLWCAFSRHNLSLQDIVLRTMVVYDWSHRIPRQRAR
jgi:uncharacterized RDD family membrane protein YckC